MPSAQKAFNDVFSFRLYKNFSNKKKINNYFKKTLIHTLCDVLKNFKLKIKNH